MEEFAIGAGQCDQRLRLRLLLLLTRPFPLRLGLGVRSTFLHPFGPIAALVLQQGIEPFAIVAPVRLDPIDDVLAWPQIGQV